MYYILGEVLNLFFDKNKIDFLLLVTGNNCQGRSFQNKQARYNQIDRCSKYSIAEISQNY